MRSRYRFAYPGFDIAWWTVVLALAGAAAIWMRLNQHQPPWYVDMCGLFAIPAIAIWFRVRPAGHFFLVFYGLGAIVGTAFLIIKMNFEVRSLLRPVIAFSTAASCLGWTRKILLENQLEDEGLEPEEIKQILADQD